MRAVVGFWSAALWPVWHSYDASASSGLPELSVGGAELCASCARQCYWWTPKVASRSCCKSEDFSPRGVRILSGHLLCQRCVLGSAHIGELTMLEVSEAETSGPADDEVENRPAKAETAGLTREAADDLGSPLDLAQRALEQVGAPKPLAKTKRVVQMDAQRRQVFSQTCRGAGVVMFELT